MDTSKLLYVIKMERFSFTVSKQYLEDVRINLDVQISKINSTLQVISCHVSNSGYMMIIWSAKVWYVLWYWVGWFNINTRRSVGNNL
jgi:hypothetical protein